MNHWVTAVSVAAPQLRELVRQVEQQESIRHTATLLVARTMKRLQLVVRQQIDALRWQMRTGNTSAALLRYYGLPLDGALPASRRRTLWLALANTLLERDALAADAAMPTLVARAALAEAYGDAEKALADLGEASRLLRSVQAARSTVRKAADLLIVQLRAELNFHLRTESPTTRRQIMRDYGIQFRPTAGDVSPGDAVVPAVLSASP